jgi:quinoprotein glucose dehydrogenase
MSLRWIFYPTLLLAAFAFVTRSSIPFQRYPNEYATDQDWAEYGGNAANTRYSALEQINASNVGQLKLAWEYHTGEIDTNNRGQIQCNPLIINGILYGVSSKINVFALDAATGVQRWKFDPFTLFGGQNSWAGTSRGLVHWDGGPDDQRIFVSAGSYLIALDAKTGKAIPSFGEGGKIDLRKDLDYHKSEFLLVCNTPGVIYKDMIIVGGRVSEGLDAAPGHIRAFDVRTGKRRWIFHTIPHPGEYGFNTWEDPTAWKRIGGANCWAGMSLDRDRGVVYLAMGSSTYDFWGGNRKGDNLFSNCVLALDAATGVRRWHFQTVHHDIWDKDLPAPPNLVRIQHKGKMVDAVAQVTKHGYIFVLNRDTGKPLFRVREKKVPQSELLGEKSSKTQPVPDLPVPFMRQQFSEKDIIDITPKHYKEISEQFRQLNSQNTLWQPPTEQGQILFPGFDGGAEWGGAAFDPSSGWLYVNANEIPWLLKMAPNESNVSPGEALYRKSCANCHGMDRKGNGFNFPGLLEVKKKYNATKMVEFLATGKGAMPAFKHIPTAEREQIANYLLDLESNAPKKEPDGAGSADEPDYWMTGYNFFETKDKYPAIKPPWGTLTAMNLNTGKIAWQVPLGEYPELTAKGIPVTGTANYGGPVVTEGGVLFIAATRDEKFRAFDKKTGKLLLELKLPAAGYATPATYSVAGKQYIVIACGGGKLGTKSGDSYVAFALSEN